jgi:hypothetical protein
VETRIYGKISLMTPILKQLYLHYSLPENEYFYVETKVYDTISPMASILLEAHLNNSLQSTFSSFRITFMPSAFSSQILCIFITHSRSPSLIQFLQPSATSSLLQRNTLFTIVFSPRFYRAYNSTNSIVGSAHILVQEFFSKDCEDL